MPVWPNDTKVHTDHHIRFLQALYSVPHRYIVKTVSVRGDSRLVRIYFYNQLIKTHPRVSKGERSTDYNDYPPEKSAYAMRQKTGAFKRSEGCARYQNTVNAADLLVQIICTRQVGYMMSPMSS